MWHFGFFKKAVITISSKAILLATTTSATVDMDKDWQSNLAGNTWPNSHFSCK